MINKKKQIKPKVDLTEWNSAMLSYSKACIISEMENNIKKLKETPRARLLMPAYCDNHDTHIAIVKDLQILVNDLLRNLEEE